MAAARFYSSTSGNMELQANITPSSPTIVVDTTTGLPGTTPFTLVIDAGQSAEEIVTVTAVAGTTLSVTRGVDGSAAFSHTAGANIRHMATARDFREPQEHIGSTNSVHGLASGANVVGTTTAQVLTNKNLTDPTNTFPSSLTTDAELALHAAATVTHGATGAIVGTTNVQTLTNKTLSQNTWTGGTIDSDTLKRAGVNVVTETDTQTITGKALSGASNTFTNIPQSAVTGLPGVVTQVDAIDTRVTNIENHTKIGKGTFSFNASGEAVLTHGLGSIPTAFVFTPFIAGASTPIYIAPKGGTATTTQVTMCAYSIAAGTPYVGTISVVSWSVSI